MTRIRSLLSVLLASLFVLGCASTGSPAASQGLVGAWLASASRAGGQGVRWGSSPSRPTVRFIRSGDTHPILSVAHGTWKQTATSIRRHLHCLAIRRRQEVHRYPADPDSHH